jgi:hypothetical protein
MQVQTLKRLIMLSVLGVLTTVSARAQAGTQFKVSIPFNFSVGGKALPAGEYLVGRATQASIETLVLRRTDGREGLFVMTRMVPADNPGESRLVFRRYEDHYFLGEVWTAGASTGRGLPLSRRERQVAQEIAKHGANPQKVSVLGNKR